MILNNCFCTVHIVNFNKITGYFFGAAFSAVYFCKVVKINHLFVYSAIFIPIAIVTPSIILGVFPL